MSQAEEERELKCAHCDFKVPAVIRYKTTSKTKDGAEELVAHVRKVHSGKARSLLRRRRGGRGPGRQVANELGEDNFSQPMPLDRIFTR